MPPTTIKCYYRNQCRRFAIIWPEDGKCRHLTKEIQGSFHLQREKILVLQYADNDADFVNFDTDAELVQAFGFAENGILKIYADDAPENAQGVRGQRGNGWKKFSEQEKLAVRQGFNLAEGALGLVKPSSKLKIIPPEGGLLSLAKGNSGLEDFAIVQQREGFGMNPSTAQVFVKLVSFGFETYNAVTEGGEGAQ